MPDGGALPLAIPADVGAAAAAARSLIGAPIDRLEPIQAGGRNSRVYRVRCGGGSFALKHYPADDRNRLRTEVDALALMARHGIAAVPRVLASDPARGYALLNWIEGGKVDRPSGPDIDEAVGFLAEIHRLRHAAGAELQPHAAEACLSGAEIAAQIHRRLGRLTDLEGDDGALAAFLARLGEAWTMTVLPQASDGYDRMDVSFSQAIAPGARSLCPADFGFHNALRGPRGLCFLDFEYFGWDDPAKLGCDFLLHPGMSLAAPLQARFIALVGGVYGSDPRFAMRFRLLYPLFAVRWCLILLNEFLPERWATRVHAGDASDWPAAKRRQLDRASSLFDHIRNDNWSLAA